MFASPYELYQFVQTKGYVVPMAGQITIESMTKPAKDGSNTEQFQGTGDHLKTVMENDRRAVYKAFYQQPEGAIDSVESTWIASETPGVGKTMPLWAERLIHAEILITQEKIDSSIDYLLHVLEREKQK